jgi:NAD+ kinase
MGNPAKPNFHTELPLVVAELRRRGAAFVIDKAVVDGLALRPGEALPVDQVSDAANLVLSFGGDGTLLRSARIVGNRRIPVLGVNLGPGLGYLTELGIDELTQSLDRILAGDYLVEERMLLTATLNDDPQPLCYALNDVVVGHASISHTMRLEVLIDGQPVTTYRCDGLIVATATGSTAYTLSAGGPIVEPTLNVMIVTPISPHTLTMRPVVISAQRAVEIRSMEVGLLAADGESIRELKEGDVIRIGRGPYPALIANITNHDFYYVLRTKLQWGRA